ncbi:ABC transporter substrate-binding protein [candidate division KSB1 bacterium]|nr:ABC transporter substrate-binding protein [candidate division KSB1 bacterium]
MPTQNEKEIKPILIGAILPLTGDAAMYGKSLQTGVNLALELINEINKQMDIVFYDSKADPKTAVSAINKLISFDKVEGIIGDMFTSTTMAIAPIAQKDNTLLISPTASSSQITSIGDNIFRLYPSEVEEGEALSDFYKQKFQNDKTGIIVVNESAMLNVSDVIKNNCNREVDFFTTYSPNIDNFKSIISKIPKDIKTLFILGYFNESINLIKQCIELNKQFNFLGLSTLYTPKLFELGVTHDNIFLTAPYFSIETEKANVKEFIYRYNEKFGKLPDVWAAYGFDATNIIFNVLEEAQEKGKRPSSVLNSLIEYPGVTGRLTINADRSISKEMKIVTIKDNAFIDAQ